MDSSNCLKKKDNFSVTALQKLQSEWPFEAFIQEARACHVGPKPALSYRREFAMVQIKLRTCMYLFRTRTYLCNHHTVLVVTCSVQKNLQSLLVHQLNAGEEGEAEVVGLLIKMHHNIPAGASMILFKFREQTKLLLSPSCSYVYV